MVDIMARRTTNYAKATYTEIIDLQTVNNKVSIIGIHTPTGDGPYTKLRGFFTQFRKFKYVGIDRMVMCPAANLPVDPLGLTDVVGTTGLMDPRDAMNPILFHGCHGDNMDTVLNGLFAKHSTNSLVDGFQNPTVGFESQSADLGNVPFDVKIGDATVPYAEQEYYRFLTDPKWRKFGIQSMVSLRKLHPLTWKLASTMPYLPVTDVDTGVINGGGNSLIGVGASTVYNTLGNALDFPTGDMTVGNSHRVFGQQFTNGVAPLGWLPTTVIKPGSTDCDIVHLPKLFMGVLILPPSYNVEQFFRLSIRHTFLFKDFTQSLDPLFASVIPDGKSDEPIDNRSYFNWIDYPDDTSSKTVVQQSVIDNGTTLDVVDGKSEVISDSAM